MRPRLALGVVFVTALLNSIGFGIIMPVLPSLLMEVTADTMAEAASFGGWLMFAYAATQFFAAPVLGALSDRFGRRPVLLVSLVVLGCDYLIMWWAPTFGWLLLGRILSGAAGATYSTCNAYVADISEPEERAQNFGLMGAAFGLGFIIGPVIGGLLGEIGPRTPFLAAAGLSFANLLWGAVVLPESLATGKRRAFEWRRANPTGALKALRRYPMVFGLVGAYVLFMMGHHVLPATWSFFTMEKFGWSPDQVGYSLGFVGVLMVLVQAVLLRAVLPKLGPRRAGSVGFTFCAAAFVGYALAADAWMLYGFLAVGALQGFATPAMQGLMTSQVGDDEQGELQGGLASMSSLTAIISPPLMTQIFATFTAADAPVYLPGAPFLAAAALTLAAWLLFLKATAELPAPVGAIVASGARPSRTKFGP